jgi:hypothetical protein
MAKKKQLEERLKQIHEIAIKAEAGNRRISLEKIARLSE